MKHVKIILSLLVVVLISMVGVFYAESITTPVIEERLEKEANQALFEIFPDAETLKNITEEFPADDKGIVKQVFRMLDAGGNELGIVYKGEVAGYQPGIIFLIGVDTVNDKVAGYNTLKNSETAGLGKDLLAYPEFTQQFVGVPTESMQENGDGIDLVAGSTARVTLGGIREGVSSALIYHAVNFKGMEAPVEETPEEKAQRYMKEFFDGATFTDVTTNYEDNDYVLEIHEASTGGYVIKALFNGYEEGSVYMLGIKDSEIVGFGLVKTNETKGIGADLVAASEFAEQIANKNVEEIKANGVDFVAGSTASFTLAGVNESLKEVLGFYNKQIAGIKDTVPPVLELNEAKVRTFEAGSAAPSWGTYVSAFDAEDGNRPVDNDADQVVDMETPGTYTVTYTAVDSSGNESSIPVEFIISAEAVEFVLVPVPDSILPELESMDDVADQFNDEGIKEGLIDGVYTGRDLDGNIVSVYYDVTSNNGGWSADNHFLVQFDLTDNSIIRVYVYDGNSSYTDDYATGKGKELGDPIVATVWEGVTGIDQVTTDDLDTVSGTTSDYSFPSFIESVEEAITYQQTNNIGGAE